MGDKKLLVETVSVILLPDKSLSQDTWQEAESHRLGSKPCFADGSHGTCKRSQTVIVEARYDGQSCQQVFIPCDDQTFE